MSNPASKPHDTLPERFWSKVNKHGPGGCWLWTASTTSGGYGQFTINGKMVRPHRLTYMAFVGDIPEGLEIDHLCHVRNCCNPDHLEAVTRQENRRRALPPTPTVAPPRIQDDQGNSLITVSEAARQLKLSPQRVRAMIANGQIPADKHGRDWAIREPLVDPRKPRGRPRKETSK